MRLPSTPPVQCAGAPERAAVEDAHVRAARAPKDVTKKVAQVALARAHGREAAVQVGGAVRDALAHAAAHQAGELCHHLLACMQARTWVRRACKCILGRCLHVVACRRRGSLHSQSLLLAPASRSHKQSAPATAAATTACKARQQAGHARTCTISGSSGRSDVMVCRVQLNCGRCCPPGCACCCCCCPSAPCPAAAAAGSVRVTSVRSLKSVPDLQTSTPCGATTSTCAGHQQPTTPRASPKSQEQPVQLTVGAASADPVHSAVNQA